MPETIISTSYHELMYASQFYIVKFTLNIAHLDVLLLLVLCNLDEASDLVREDACVNMARNIN